MGEVSDNLTFDAVEFALYLRDRWRVIGLSCVSALVFAVALGAILPTRYTATATLIVGIPAGTDPRAMVAVSPVYLESLKTYQSFAESNTLFATAVDALALRRLNSGQGIEAMRRSVLAVSRAPNSRVIEIKATLGDPGAAKKLAEFIAQQTVALSRSLDQHAADDAITAAQSRVDAAQARLDASLRTKTQESADMLDDELRNATELEYAIDRELISARAELADLTGSGEPGGAKTANVRARIAVLEEQQEKQAAAAAEKAAQLQRAKPYQDSLDTEQRLARADLESARSRLNDIGASSAFRGERLQVLDPGVVPERPSSPNRPLIALAAIIVSSVTSIVWLAAAFGYRRAIALRAERVYAMR